MPGCIICLISDGASAIRALLVSGDSAGVGRAVVGNGHFGGPGLKGGQQIPPKAVPRYPAQRPVFRSSFSMAFATVSLASSDWTRTWKDCIVPLTPPSNSFPSITNGVGEISTIAPLVFLDPLWPKRPRLMAVIPGTDATLLRISRASAEGMSSRRLTVVPQIVA